MGVISVNLRRGARAEADTFFSTGPDFVVDDGEGGWEMVEGVRPSYAEGDGLGGVAETEGAQAQLEEEPAMAPEARECLPSL